MDYSFFERLFNGTSISRGGFTPKCDVCRTRTQIQGMPQTFLLPVYQDKEYTASAEYYAKVCQPLLQGGYISVGQRACRMWPLVCPKCGARAVLVVDFLLVRGQEVTEKIEVCDYAPLAYLLSGFNTGTSQNSSSVQSFGYEQVIRTDHHRR